MLLLRFSRSDPAEWLKFHNRRHAGTGRSPILAMALDQGSAINRRFLLPSPSKSHSQQHLCVQRKGSNLCDLTVSVVRVKSGVGNQAAIEGKDSQTGRRLSVPSCLEPQSDSPTTLQTAHDPRPPLQGYLKTRADGWHSIPPCAGLQDKAWSECGWQQGSSDALNHG